MPFATSDTLTDIDLQDVPRPADGFPRVRVLAREGTTLTDVTSRAYPWPLLVTDLVAILDDEGGFEEIILRGTNRQLLLTRSPVGVRCQYADPEGASYPDVWYASVKPQFRP